MKDYMKISLLVTAGLIVIFALAISAKNIAAARNGINTAANVDASANQYGINGGGGTANQASAQGEVQTATLKVVGGKYVITPSIFKKGVPVRFVADIPNMPGCSKSFTIPDFNVVKYLSASDNIIEFTPDKSGTFRVACTMNMYTGSFQVSDDGTTATLTAAQTVIASTSSPSVNAGGSTGGTCGANGGGCGCGG